MHDGKQVPDSCGNTWISLFPCRGRRHTHTHFETPIFNKPSAATTRFSLCTEACSTYSQHSAIFFLDKIFLLHINTPTGLTPVAKHALQYGAYCCFIFGPDIVYSAWMMNFNVWNHTQIRLIFFLVENPRGINRVFGGMYVFLVY